MSYTQSRNRSMVVWESGMLVDMPELYNKMYLQIHIFHPAYTSQMPRGARQDSKMTEEEAGQQKLLKGPAWDTCLGRDSYAGGCQPNPKAFSSIQTNKNLPDSNKLRQWGLKWTLSACFQFFWSSKLSLTSGCFVAMPSSGISNSWSPLNILVKTSLLQGKLCGDWVRTRCGTSQSTQPFSFLAHEGVYTFLVRACLPIRPCTYRSRNCFHLVPSKLSNP